MTDCHDDAALGADSVTQVPPVTAPGATESSVSVADDLPAAVEEMGLRDGDLRFRHGRGRAAS
jgi:hypothetical protein